MNLGPFSSKIYELKKDKILILLLILSIIIQVLFLLANVIGFECDAAMFYNYAKAIILIGRSASDYRPPAFPLFLLITGQVWPGTFLVTLLCQSLMGVLMPILVYKVLKHFGNSLAIVGAIFIIFSTISYNYSTLMLSDQLFGFTFLLSIYFFTNFFFEKNDSDLKWFLVISLICTFTRWEGIFLLINGLVYATFYYCKLKRHKFIITLILSILILFACFTVIRALYFKDAKMIGTLQNGTGSQLLFRLYGADYSGTMEKISNRGLSEGRKSNTNSTIAPPEHGNSIQYFNVLNGPSNRRVSEIVENFADSYPDSFRKRKDSILSLPESKLYANSYETLFGRFDGNPKKLVEHIFTTPTNGLNAQYVYYVDSAVKSTLGVVEGDKLLIKASIETMVANPIIIISMLNESLSLLGVDLLNFFLYYKSENTVTRNLNILFPYWSNYQYSWFEFDLGKCATNALSHNMIRELIISYNYVDLSLNQKLTDFASYNRNLTRVSTGIIIIMFGWVLLLSKNRFYLAVLFASFAPMLITYGVFIGGAYTRYEVATLPILIIIAMIICAEFRKRFLTPFIYNQ